MQQAVSPKLHVTKFQLQIILLLANFSDHVNAKKQIYAKKFFINYQNINDNIIINMMKLTDIFNAVSVM